MGNHGVNGMMVSQDQGAIRLQIEWKVTELEEHICRLKIGNYNVEYCTVNTE